MEAAGWKPARSVLEALIGMPAFQQVAGDDRAAVWLACLLYEGPKPDLRARAVLWEREVPFALREQVCGLLRFGWLPPVLIERDDAERMAAALSFACRADLLAIVAEARLRGLGGTRQELDQVALFRVFCEEQGCIRGPRPFPSDHTRVTYFRSRSRAPDALAHDDCRAELVLMSGLPGAGKDTWVRDNLPELPTVSLDDLRLELGVAPDDDQGTVQQAGREALRARLRQGEPFVHLATNLDRQRRRPILGLAADYRFRVRIVYVEVPPDRLFRQNREREARVPEHVIRQMTGRWEVPTLAEAHRLDLAIDR